MEHRTRIAVVAGGLSEESATNRLGEAIVRAAQKSASEAGWTLDVDVISIRALASEIAGGSLSGFAGEHLAAAYEKVGNADAVIALTPTFKASYTGLFKAFWDVSPDGLIADTPVMLGATGGSERHSLMVDTAMRPLFAYMSARSLPTSIYAATSDWAGNELNRRIERAADELVGTVMVRKGAASGSGPRKQALASRREAANDPFANVMTMDQMLGH